MIKFTVDKKTLIYVLVILPFLIPSGLYFFSIFDIIAKLKYLSVIYIIIKLIGNKKCANYKLVHSIELFAIAIFLVTFFKTYNLLECLKKVMEILIPVYWMCLVNASNKKEQTINFLKKILLFIIFANLFTEIIFPRGIVLNSGQVNPVYLLGDKNKMIMYLLPTIGIILYNENQKSSKVFNRYFLYIITIMSFIYAKTTTGIIVSSLCFLLIEITKNKTYLKIFLKPKFFIFMLIIIGVVIISGTLENNSIWINISAALGKNAGFSGRTFLWNQALEKISKSPFIGYGATEEAIRSFSFFTSEGQIDGFSTHNGYLRLLLEGGILLFLLYVRIIIVFINSNKKRWMHDFNYMMVFFVVLGMLVTYLFEAEYFSSLFIILLLICQRRNTSVRKNKELVYKISC